MLFFDMLLKVVFAVNFVTRSGVFRFSRMLKPLCKTKNLEKISWNMIFDLWWKRSCLRSSCAPMLNYGRTRARWPGWNWVTFTHFPCFCTFSVVFCTQEGWSIAGERSADVSRGRHCREGLRISWFPGGERVSLSFFSSLLVLKSKHHQSVIVW